MSEFENKYEYSNMQNCKHNSFHIGTESKTNALKQRQTKKIMKEKY